jgi:hypothetical protein
MAKVHALMEFTAPDGETYAIGDELELPRDTDRQKADFDRLIADGVVTRSEKAANPPDPTSERQRTRRERTGN